MRLACILLVTPFCLPSVAQTITYRTVAVTGQAAPGTADGDTFNAAFGATGLDDAGHAGVRASVAGPVYSGQYGLWSESAGSLSLLALNGSPAPGASPGVNFASGTGFPTFGSTGGGRTVFLGLLSGAGVNSTNNQGIWSDGSGSASLIARSGFAAPGAGTGVVFASSLPNFSYAFNPLVINRPGKVAFSAGVTGPGITSANNAGIWSDVAGSLSLVVSKGSAAPGTPPGVNFNGFASDNRSLSMNDSGRLAFQGALSGPGVSPFVNDSGIWTTASGSTALVARAGALAPGTNATFASSFAHPRINNAGQVVFFDLLNGTGVTSANNRGIWSGMPGALSLVARSGDPAPGTVAGVTFSTPGQQLVFNHAGNTAFMSLVTGSGVTSNNNEGIWSDASGSLSLIARTGDPAPGTDPGVTFVGDFTSLTMNGAGQIAFIAHVTGPNNGNGFNNSQGIWATDPSGVLRLVARGSQLLEVVPGVFDKIEDASLGLIGGSGGEDGYATGFNDQGQLVFRASFNHAGQGIFVASVPEPMSLTLLAVGSALFFARGRLR